MKRIGPRMRDVVDYVTAHPGCTKYDPALRVAPHGSVTVHFGYRVVNRCIVAGLLTARRLSNRYELFVA